MNNRCDIGGLKNSIVENTRTDETYILLNGLTYNPAEYFTSFERIFPSPERARKNARNE